MTEPARDITTREEAPASETSTVLSMIERAARDPSVDIDRMVRLMEMRDSMLDRQARVAFAVALADMQPNLPVIDERGRIEVKDKNNPNRVIQSTSFAQWEDINDAIKPILHSYGFSLSFRTGTAPDGKITVTAVLRHRDGYQEETTLALPHDSSGSKNAVQAVGSSTSYGKRYTALALLNVTSRAKPDRDDDGVRAGEPPVITDEQAEQIRDALASAGGDIGKFLAFFRVESVPDLPASRFKEAMELIRRRSAR